MFYLAVLFRPFSNQRQMHPLTGHGGNSAIESAAYLADLLKGLLERKGPTSSDIRTVFYKYQQARRSRTGLLMKEAHQQQQVESLDTPFLKFIALHVLKTMGQEKLLQVMVSGPAPGHSLRHLPLSSRSGVVAFADEVKIKSDDRSIIATLSWIMLLVTSASVPYLLAHRLGLPWNELEVATTRTSSRAQLYYVISAIAANGLWAIESSRCPLYLTALRR